MTGGRIKSVLLWGGRSKARIVCRMLKDREEASPITIFDNTLAEIEFPFDGRHMHDIEELKAALPDFTHFIVCIGGEHGYARVQTARALESLGLAPIEMIHDTAYIDSTTTVGAGIHVMPSATIHAFCSIGDYCIINTSSSIDHESRIGDGVHVMGAAAIAGRVEIGEFATIGTNATVLPDLKIGVGSFIGAGAVVTKDVPDHCVVVGSPARKLRDNAFRFSREMLNRLVD